MHEQRAGKPSTGDEAAMGKRNAIKAKRFRRLSLARIARLKKQAAQLDLDRFARKHAQISKGADIGNLVEFFNDTERLIEYARFLERSIDELRKPHT